MRILLSIALLLPGLLYGQIKPHPSYEKVSTVKGLPPSVDSIQVNYSTLMKIARKYDVDKKFEYRPGPNNISGKPPKKVYLKMSLEQFDDWMKRLGFEEKKVKVLNQFFLKDFQEFVQSKNILP